MLESLLGSDVATLPPLREAAAPERAPAPAVGPAAFRGTSPSSPAPPAQPATWQLRGRPGPGAPMHEVPVSTFPFTIGRKVENTLSLLDPTVSGRHAEIAERGRELLLRDLGSTNGTFVNGNRIADVHRLCDGDVIQFGSAKYVASPRRENNTKATITANVADEALAHLLFDRLLKLPAVQPHFQPIVRLGDNGRVGYEVLARSDLPGLETPAAMFRVAAERGRETELSQVLRREGMKLARPLGRHMDFYLNTHPSELGGPELIASVEQLRAEFPDRRVTLEVHEAAVTSTKQLAELRERLTALGVRLAYDDFGAGQSRLMELADAPPDVLKFDMHLIRGLPKASAERQRLVASLVEVARGLGVVTLAEGIETADEATACRDVGFELAQGYFFGRPAAADAWKA